jgi:nitrogen regulatory protein P-II 1
MKMIIAVIKPFKLNDVRDALTKLGVQGMTVTDVRGYGRQKGQTEMYEGKDAAVQFVNKLKIDVCVNDDQVDQACEVILKAASSGKIGDGKIFVYDVDRVVRIRTGEKDAAAV